MTNDELEQLAKDLNMEIVRIDCGDVVLCDSCNKEYSSGEEINAVGGVLFCSNAYCPECTPRIILGAKKYGEQGYLEYPRPNETFRDFVYRIRERG